MTDLRKRVRLDQTLSEIERLQKEFESWKKDRIGADTKSQYQTQLQALDVVVKDALVGTKQDTETILDDQPDLGTVYARCSLQEKRTLWVRRVLWGYFREKFDQRDQSDELRKLLEAADDVVWSCYYETHQQIDQNAPLKPIPLTYIEPFYSPRALPRDEPPGLLIERRLGAEFLAGFFERLPIPLLSMPPNTQAAPWWLVYLGHEVGHHVQHDFDLVDHFADLLFDVASKAPDPVETPDAAQRWYNWGQEIFADVYSVYMMGAAALWAMAELETHPDGDMLLRKDVYPSPAARLALLAQVADELGLGGTVALRGEDAQQRVTHPPASDFEGELQLELKADLAMLGKVVEAVTTRSVGPPGTLAKLTGWNGSDLLPSGALGDWQTYLIKNDATKAKPALSSARLIVSAGIESWSTITNSTPQATWRAAAGLLGKRMLTGIEQYRDKTTRAADSKVVQDVSVVAADIREQLRHADFADW